MTLATLGLAGTSEAFQREIQGRVRVGGYRDSHNGLWGPSAMVLALEDYGAPGYEVRAYKSRQGALRDAARAIMATRSPVILLAWRGAHTWIMTGFRADADPTIFRDARIDGATSSTRGTRISRVSGARRIRPARSRMMPRWSATSSRGSDPKAGTRTATACSSRSCRRSSTRPVEPDPAADAANEEQAQAAHPWWQSRPRSQAGWRGSPAARAWPDWRTTAPSPANDEITW